MNQMANFERIHWVVEADIKSFFDSIPRDQFKDVLAIRVVDGSMMRLIGKCLNAGVLDGAEFSSPSKGTVQGSIIWPLLGNVYLHYVLDVWFQEEMSHRLSGYARLVRYADVCAPRRRGREVMK